MPKKFSAKNETSWKRAASLILLTSLLIAACGGAETVDESAAITTTALVEAEVDSTETSDPASSSGDLADSSTFQIEVWADNWSAVYVNGELIGEDSVPITTERSFNAETFTFEAAYPFTLAIEAKDFKETDSGIEYIGEGNQQMGDGGLIAQVTDATTGEVVAISDSSWAALVIHRAPLNTDCESDPDPDATCEFESTSAPTGWADADFDDSSWTSATIWSEADVGPKDGYDEISWDSAAELIWGTDLEVDNTVLLRTTVGS
jgi:hypothetical protein